MKIIAYIIAMVFFLGGLLLMGYAFEPGSGEGIMFAAGILCVAISLAVPFSILRRLDRG